jgi:hypothetical protein
METNGRKTVKGEKTSAPKAVKAKSKAADSTTAAPVATTTAKAAPTIEEIAKRSYELYLQRGAVDGYHEQDWLQAESELLAGR